MYSCFDALYERTMTKNEIKGTSKTVTIFIIKKLSRESSLTTLGLLKLDSCLGKRHCAFVTNNVVTIDERDHAKLLVESFVAKTIFRHSFSVSKLVKCLPRTRNETGMVRNSPLSETSMFFLSEKLFT